MNNKKKSRSGKNILLILAGLGVLAAGVVLPIHSADALRLTLKRITFEGRKRTEVITIINNEAQPQTYRLGWRQMRMTEDKALQSVEEGEVVPGLMPVDDLVRFAPRRVTVPPGGTQQVRLMLRKPKDLPEGEYRSHFWIQPEAEAAKFGEQQAAPTGSPIQLKMLTGITLPVIVRHGTLDATGVIENGKAVRAGEDIDVSFTVVRSGNKSLYGDVDMVCTGGGDENIRTIRGVAVYAEVTRRNLTFTMPVPADVSSCAQITVIYREPPDQAGNLGKVIAETTLKLS